MSDEVQNAVVLRLNDACSRWHFRKMRQFGNAMLARPTNGGSQVVDIGMIRSGAGIGVVVGVGIRVDGVEERVNRYQTAYTPFPVPKRLGERTLTIGAELGQLIDGRQRRREVMAVAAVDEVVAEVTREIEGYGLPWLDRFSDLREVYRTLAADDDEAQRMCPVAYARAMRAIALAAQLGVAADDVRALVTRKLNAVKQAGDAMLPLVERFSEELTPSVGQAH